MGNRVIVRDEKIIVKLSSEKKAELQGISEQMGVSMSAIGAYVIGQWLMQQKMVQQPLMNKVGDAVVAMMQEQLGNQIKLVQGE